MNKIISRMGDGWVVALSEAALKRELEDGTLDAAVQGEIEPLPEDELKYLFEICRSGNKMTGVEAKYNIARLLGIELNSLRASSVRIGTK